jgi:hypothetical protein
MGWENDPVAPPGASPPAKVQQPWEVDPIAPQPQAQPEGPLEWSDVPGMALQNALPSAYRFGEAMVYPFMHPLQTVGAVGDLGAGALRAGAQAVLPESTFNYLDTLGGEENSQRAAMTADAVANFYIDRYGSEEGFKRALAEDPVGVMADASTVLTGGASASKTLLGPLSRITKGIDVAAKATNPLTVPIKAAKLGGVALKHGLGLTTGTSADAVGEAYKAGKAGGKQKWAFNRNLRGHEDSAVVIDDARSALGQMAEDRARQYTKDMAVIKADKTPINFRPIEQKFLDVVDSMYNSGHQVAADETIGKLGKIQDVLAEWSADKSMHTAGGLDALKRRIDNLMPSFTDANVGDTERAITAIRNAVKEEVIAAAPQYAKAMSDYETSKVLQREIERTLSLNKKASADTTLRKMQSVTRNNANTNYGSRVGNVEALDAAGTGTIMPRLAGQSLNNIVPRGLMGPLTAAGVASGAYFTNPLFLAGLPLTSPRLVGEAAQAAGTAARWLEKLPKPTREQLLLALQAGRVGQIDDGMDEKTREQLTNALEDR